MYEENLAAATLMAFNATAAATNNNINNGISASTTASTTPNANSNAINSNTVINASPLVNQLLTVKDSRWLQLEVCREFQRGQCSRTELECKFAHPPLHVDVQNGRVTACYDSIKGRCTRENPKCKYLHPPQHLKDQLLINGRQHLQLKNQICSQFSTQTTALPQSIPLIAQIVQQQQQILPNTLSYQYFSQLPATLYPTLLPSTASTGNIDSFPVQAVGNRSNGNIPPLKRSFVEKNATDISNAAVAAAAATATVNGLPPPIPIYATQFNPYFQSIPIAGAYLPALSFNGQIPPRF